MLHPTKLLPPALLLSIALLPGSCSPALGARPNSPASVTPDAAQTFVVEALTRFAPTQTLEPTPTRVPAAYNPLTGLPVQDPALLQWPALLISISHFPVNARPQAGLSFAPYVFEIYITEGATRFLTAFYGQFPAPEVPIVGDCEIRSEPFRQSKALLGNQVWLDANANSLHDAWENGVGGVCVDLYDPQGRLLQQTTTDSNGYYGFNVEAGTYVVGFQKPAEMELVAKDAGQDGQDSDADPATGRTDAVEVSSSRLDVDAGLVPLRIPPPTHDLPLAKVGPVRSGRMVYRHIAAFFPDSCLIYAFASAEVLQYLPKCAFVDHDVQGGGYMLDISEMVRLAKQSRDPDHAVDYTSNVYSADPPEGGEQASRLHVYIAWLNQAEWVYDPLYQGWWRYVDNADPETAGVVHPEVDRLTRRQLHFENVIVLFAKHDVISPTNLEIHLEQDWLGDALLFRDERVYKIRWSTVASDEEFRTGRRKPIQFLYPDDKTPFPLKPGHTWIVVVTPETTVTERSAGEWLLQFSQPPGAK